MSQHEKRELREHKRAIKRLGNQRLRRQARQVLFNAPEAAAELEPDYGRLRSSELNGIDRDRTRRRRGSALEQPGAEP